ncbi:MAG: flagellar basal-body MS-ring/collar protein FliF [Rickettsiaceae bacterium]|nr:flagellar basal-body MS-ring/collar protein FliF [Rickettsiaceae bacterium]
MPVIVQFFKEISPAKLAASAIALVAFLVLFAIFMSKLGDNEFSVLYTDLDIQDSAKIAEELDNRKISYRAMFDGSTIKVSKAEVVSARLALAQVGLPTSGSVIGYEIFDKEDSIGATNFSQNVKLIRALEGELSRTISAFDQVTKARVHLVMPQREIFSKEKLEPRASVVLKFRGSKRLGRPEIDAISHLVVTSVPGLEMKNVTIVDTKGNALKIGSSEEGMEFASGKNEEVRVAAENRLKNVIESLLTRSVGAGKVKAQVALEMNFDRVVTNSEVYDPDGAVVRSTQSLDERDQTPVSSAGGTDASVANNIPGGGDSGDGSLNFAISEKSDQTTNYEISKIIKNHISESGVVTKMSIGILVDGHYKMNQETGESEYTERSQADLDKIANLIKVAIGFDDDRNDRIEVINMRFSSELDGIGEDDSDWLKEELPNLFQTLIFAIVVLLVLITVIRPIALKAFEIRKTGEEDSGVLESNIGVDGMPIIGSSVNALVGIPSEGEAPEVSVNKVDPLFRINEIADSSPQDLVNVLRKWLNEES